MTPTYANLADNVLLEEIARLAMRERLATGELVAVLAEVDARKLYLGEGYSSLFVYCTRALHLSEHAAYGRIEAARAARRFPLILELLVEGAITLTTVTLLAPHLTAENCRTVLEAARHKSKRGVEVQVAELRPLPPAVPSIRRVPERRTPAAAEANRPMDDLPTAAVLPPKPPVVKPLAPEQYKIQFTMSYGDARQAPAGAGPAASLDTGWGPGEDLRQGALAVTYRH